MLCVIISEYDECLHMWCGRKRCQRGTIVQEPECDAALSMHTQPTAVHLEVKPLNHLLLL